MTTDGILDCSTINAEGRTKWKSKCYVENTGDDDYLMIVTQGRNSFCSYYCYYSELQIPRRKNASCLTCTQFPVECSEKHQSSLILPLKQEKLQAKLINHPKQFWLNFRETFFAITTTYFKDILQLISVYN